MLCTVTMHQALLPNKPFTYVISFYPHTACMSTCDVSAVTVGATSPMRKSRSDAICPRSHSM